MPITPELFEATLFGRYAYEEDTPAEREKAVQATRAELEDLVLIDVLVENRDKRFAVEHFQQPGSDQVPYDERYLSPDGRAVIATGFKIPKVEPLRLLFFLHFVDFARPLGSTYGAVPLPPPSPMPDHFRFLAPYTPIG